MSSVAVRIVSVFKAPPLDSTNHVSLFLYSTYRDWELKGFWHWSSVFITKEVNTDYLCTCIFHAERLFCGAVLSLQWERREGKNPVILTSLYLLLDIALKLHCLAIWICCILKSIISAVHSAYSRCAQKANIGDLRILSASTVRQIVRCVQLCSDQMWHGSVGYLDIHMPGFQGRR